MRNLRGEATALRSKEQEWKRSRGAIACAECRRLKLKCDKSVPCTSCRRRGCASICPNGSLVTGQGTRFVLADTDRLHNKITDMSDRIRQLEDALALSHFNISRDPHPLLQRDLLKVKSIIDLHAAVDQESEEAPPEHDESQSLDLFGTLALRDDGASTTFYGRSAGQESLLLGEKEVPDDSPSPPGPSSGPFNGLPYSLVEIANAFPDSTVRLPLYALEGYLPPWERASQLCALYLEQAPWFFGAVRPRQLHEELLPLFYSEAPRPPQYTQQQATPHDLGLLFVIFCFGALTDEALPPAPGNTEADTYYVLTRAALAQDPVMDHAPTVSTVQALSLMGIYQGLVANEHSIEATWALMGLATKLAQSIGLHRDCARWKLSPAEVQKRRALFWELFITDCWQSLATGRLSTYPLPFVDCEIPQDTEQTMTADGTPQVSFPYWKAQFGKQCVSEVVAGILTARPPKYSVILELDRKVRDMNLPKFATDPAPEGAPFHITMQHYMPINYRHLTLLYIHRTFLAQGLCDHPHDPLRSQYAPSILSGYRSACQILNNLREGFALFPVPIARFWVLWTHAFSAAVILALIPVRAPQSKMAHTALLELKSAYELFERAANYGGRAVKMLPIVRRHLEKAEKSFKTARSEALQGEVFPQQSRDEFAVFSGVTSTVSAPARQQPQQLGLSRKASTMELTSGLPSATTGDYEQQRWVDAHPALVDQLAHFDGSLDAQIKGSGWRIQGMEDEMLQMAYPSQTPSHSLPAQSQASQPLQQPAYPSQPHHSHSSHSPPFNPGPSHQSLSRHPSSSNRPSSSHQSAASHRPSSSHHSAYPPPQQQLYDQHSPMSLRHQASSSSLHTLPQSLPPQHQPQYSNSSAFQPAPHAPPSYNTQTYSHGQTPPSELSSSTSYHSSHSPISMTTPGSTSSSDPEYVDPQAQQKLWSVPHTEVEAMARERTASARARDRVLRQSGDLSLTEAWSAFMSQM
ncbi:hypothetical protein BV25DRAFT_1889043 [Artomyces pyxidatus]|uniref:Uncharacterized protein n=1 Tax=Artomyces pyxidatus TaxID=48021 RepID=A0ACB8SW99_9AGAM|nr:hypothetical protein BV25DRAFT_1889043 [Artomyces pyxidatus]